MISHSDRSTVNSISSSNDLLIICTETVHWFVVKDAITASKEQIDMLHKLMPKNNFRQIQPLNKRTIFSEIVSDL
ncbi:carbonic anhydrase family protein [Flammeovirga yaeyamensis]|uniref:Carbonic anhydrase family protein n=1 Tax=Flammeovirga yaeyamensis TaxID=367791 RepID=A0AAX1N4N8_9BACT|nr:hypothetical protein [Flammeovirga yaeyamensis]QWG02412.1 carbonic anhydrase family protein [Flammeovirga yaeyamensis]